MSLSYKSIVTLAENNIRTKKYIPKGNFIDFLAYNFPDEMTYSFDDLIENNTKQRVYNIVQRIYKYNNIEPDDRQTLSAFGDIDYVGTSNGIIHFNPGMVKDLNDSELAFVFSHEIAHNLCGHEILYNKLSSIHNEISSFFAVEKNDYFNSLLVRSFEYEADAVGVFLCKDIVEDAYAYRSESGKFQFLFWKDMEEFNLFSSHASSCDRVAYLDKIDFSNYKFQISDYKKRLKEINDVNSIEDKIKAEMFYYKKLSDMFTFENMVFQKRVNNLDNLSDERRFQYERAIKSLVDFNKKFGKRLQVLSDNRLSYRRYSENYFIKNLLLLKDGQQKIKDSLSFTKRAKILTHNLFKKGKEDILEWQW